MESSKRSFLSLPVEIIEKIIECNVISYPELCRLSCVSRNFYYLINSNRIWKKKCEQKWPYLAQKIDAPNTDWKYECRRRLDFKVMLKATLKKMSDYFYSEPFDDNVYISMTEISQYYPLSNYIIDEELLSIMNDPDKLHNLNLQYSAKRFFGDCSYHHWKEDWKLFLSQNPSTNVILLQGARLIALVLRPTKPNCVFRISSWITSLSEKVFQEVAKRSPNHSLIKSGMLDNGDVKESSCWSSNECRIVLCCINAVMFEELGFSTCSIYRSVEDILIDEVLINRSGISEIIAIVYKIVAAKLGVVCLPEGFAGKFYLKWLSQPHLDEIEEYTFIDVNNNGAFRSWDDVSSSAPIVDGNAGVWYAASEPLKILKEMCLHLIEEIPYFFDGESMFYMRGALELFRVFSPYREQLEILEARCCIQLEGYTNFHFRSVAEKRVKYAVGMVMRHTESNETCVIYAWERLGSSIYNPPHVNWLNDPSVIILVYYYVLVEKGLKLLVAEDDLEIDRTNEPISNGEVGKYFESFNGFFYITNHFVDLQYPEDARVREKFFRRSNSEA